MRLSACSVQSTGLLVTDQFTHLKESQLQTNKYFHDIFKMAWCSIDLSFSNLILFGVLAIVIKKLIGFYQQWKIEKMLEKWDNSPKDKVILHTVWRCKPLPSISSFGLKLETYLRLAKIPYELDYTDPWGPKGKIPWISYNGTHVADSHLIIEYLNKKLEIDLNKGRPSKELAAAKASRIVLENHFMWGLVYYRLIENVGAMSQLLKFPGFFKIVVPMLAWKVKNRMDDDGIGKNTPTEIYRMTEDDLRTVSDLLGSKKFLGGDEPCEDDCGVFGMVAQAVWGLPGSNFERLVHDELTNLKQYCERMKELCWPDWEKCVDKS